MHIKSEAVTVAFVQSNSVQLLMVRLGVVFLIDEQNWVTLGHGMASQSAEHANV